MAGLVTFIAVVACAPALSGGSQPASPSPDETKASAQRFEVLVQYRDDVEEPQKVAVRKSVGGRIKERLDSPAGTRNLEVLVVPRTKKLDSIDRVVAALRRHKAVRIAEPQQAYTRQSTGPA